MTYVPPYELTKIDIAALRHADHIVAWLDCNGVVGSKFEAVKRAEKTEKNPFATDVRHEIAAPVRCHHDYRDENATWSCVESVSLFPSQACQASSALATLRVGDAIALEFYPDSDTTQALREHGFHGDVFNLHIHRKGKLVATFELGSCTSQDNSVRMCKRITTQYALTA